MVDLCTQNKNNNSNTANIKYKWMPSLYYDSSKILNMFSDAKKNLKDIQCGQRARTV